jgi:putative sigma-54 modulation protein
MKLLLKFHSIPRQPQLEEHVRYRANFEMGRFARRLLRLDVTLADENGPRGGIDKTCRITARLRDLAPVVISTTDSSERDAVDRSFHRLRRAVARALERGGEGNRAAPTRVADGDVVSGNADDAA